MGMTLQVPDWVNKILGSEFLKDFVMYGVSGFLLGSCYYLANMPPNLTLNAIFSTAIPAAAAAGLYQAAKYVLVFLEQKAIKPNNAPAPAPVTAPVPAPVAVPAPVVAPAPAATAAPPEASNKLLVHRMI